MIVTLAINICLLSLVHLASSSSDSKALVFQHVEEWKLWKSYHGKAYDSHLEELERHLVWLSNKVFVEQHNAHADRGFYSYKMKLNHFADLVSFILLTLLVI